MDARVADQRTMISQDPTATRLLGLGLSTTLLLGLLLAWSLQRGEILWGVALAALSWVLVLRSLAGLRWVFRDSCNLYLLHPRGETVVPFSDILAVYHATEPPNGPSSCATGTSSGNPDGHGFLARFDTDRPRPPFETRPHPVVNELRALSTPAGA